MDERIRLLTVRLKPAGEERWLDIALNAPAGFDREGEYIDLGPCLREAFGGGVMVALGAELELRVSWRLLAPGEDE